jgi:hypothetical protein
MTVAGEYIYTPISAIVILIISLFAVSVVISKRSGGGLLGSVSGNSSLIYYVSSSKYETSIETEFNWANRVVYISLDKANLTNSVSIILFDPTVVVDGTMLTIFNSPASPAPAKLSINWSGTPASTSATLTSIDISLGTGQGVTLVTERRIGSHYITQTGGINFAPPDLNPAILQPRDWKVYRYHNPQLSMCAAVNGVTSSTYGATTDGNAESPCGGQNITNSGIGYDNYGTTSCTSYICQCPNPLSVYPLPTSVWCKT